MDVDRAASIARLKDHPAWPDLVAEVEETVDRYAAALAKTMLATGKPFENFEYKRGVLAGLREFARYPESATAAVKKDLARQTKEAVE